jgi:homoserine kinase
MAGPTRRAAVRAPATSANLGPGFDALGLCLGLYDDLEATATATDLRVEVSGAGADEVPTDEGHLVVRSLRAALDAMDVPQPGLTLSTVNRIPHGRGLGSSAAAIVAGIQLAAALYPDHALTTQAALSLADAIEGHADNVAACLLGGLTIAWTDESGAHATRLDVDTRVRAHVLVPSQAVSTEVARAVLPAEVPHRDAAINAGRSALLVAALTKDPSLLLAATEDRLHQRFRGPAMPESLALVDRLRGEGVAAAVSGAGPSVLVLCVEGDGEESAANGTWSALVPDGWVVLSLPVDHAGATVVQPH